MLLGRELGTNGFQPLRDALIGLLHQPFGLLNDLLGFLRDAPAHGFQLGFRAGESRIQEGFLLIPLLLQLRDDLRWLALWRRGLEIVSDHLAVLAQADPEFLGHFRPGLFKGALRGDHPRLARRLAGGRLESRHFLLQGFRLFNPLLDLAFTAHFIQVLPEPLFRGLFALKPDSLLGAGNRRIFGPSHQAQHGRRRHPANQFPDEFRHRSTLREQFLHQTSPQARPRG